jgi:hypothetical protein
MAIYAPNTPFTVVRVIAGVMLLIAVGRHPYSYYQLLRVVVCCVAWLAAVRARERKLDQWLWAFGAMALLFNPFVPATMSRESWQVFNLIGAGMFAASFSNPALAKEP